MIGKELQRDLVEGSLDRGDLGDDVNAVAILFDHPLDATYLTLNPTQALQHGLLVLAVAAGLPGLTHESASASSTPVPKLPTPAAGPPTNRTAVPPRIPVPRTNAPPFPQPL